jgi:hypothetical protein
MKKKIIKLTELDLEKLVRRILKEDYDQEMSHDQEEMDEVWRLLNRLGVKNGCRIFRKSPTNTFWL